jgi:hypothetical protein
MGSSAVKPSLVSEKEHVFIGAVLAVDPLWTY